MTTTPGPGTTGGSGSPSGSDLLQFAKKSNLLNPNMTVGELLDHASMLQSQHAGADLPHILATGGYVLVIPHPQKP